MLLFSLFLIILCRIKFESPEVDYYRGDKELPVYSRVQCGYPVGDLVNILLKSDLDLNRVWAVQPLSITENSCFVVDIDSVDFQDLKADDLGAWSTTGTKKCFFRFAQSGTLRVTDKKPSNSKFNYFTLTRRYYIHKSYDKFHRQLVDIKGMLKWFNTL